MSDIALHSVLKIIILNPPNWCTYTTVWLLHGWCHMKLLPSWHTFYVHQTNCTSLQCHHNWSLLCRVHVCLAVTCHLHFQHNDQDLLHATAVYIYIYNGGGTDTETRVSKERWPWRRNFSCHCCRQLNLQVPFWSQVWHSTSELWIRTLCPCPCWQRPRVFMCDGQSLVTC